MAAAVWGLMGRAIIVIDIQFSIMERVCKTNLNNFCFTTLVPSLSLLCNLIFVTCLAVSDQPQTKYM